MVGLQDSPRAMLGPHPPWRVAVAARGRVRSGCGPGAVPLGRNVLRRWMGWSADPFVAEAISAGRPW